MLSRIHAQAAAIRAALLQNAKQSNDFYNFLNPDIPDCNIKRHMSRSMHRLQGLSSQASHSFTLCKEYAHKSPILDIGYRDRYRYGYARTALLHSLCAMMVLRFEVGYWMQRQIQIRMQLLFAGMSC